ncbi:MAG: efflux transporter outer membrane subunit [Prevotella sp.]
MKKRLFTYMLATGMLTSCGIYTRYENTAQVPDNLYGRVDSMAVADGTGMSVADSAGIGGVAWREMFTDPYLQSLIDEGLHSNTDYLSAGQRILEAEATLRSARLALLPSFALAPQGSVSSFDGHKAVQTYSLPLTASWELDIFARMRNTRQQAKALYAQSLDYRQAVRSQLIAGIANCYYTLLMLDAQLLISRETEASYMESVAATRALMEAGMADEAAVAQMEAALSSVSASILDLQEQINQVENSMARLLATTPRHIRRGTLSGQPLPQSISCGIPLSLLSARPDVRAAGRQMEQAFYGVNAARSAFYPSLTLSGSVGWTNNSGAAIVNPGKILASAVGQLTQPLLARGQLSGQLKIARAQQEEARLAFQQTLLNAGTEVNDAYTQYQTAAAKTTHITRQVELLARAAESTRLMMDHGTTTYLEVLTAQQALLSARLTQAANTLAQIQGTVNLYKALGGGAE